MVNRIDKVYSIEESKKSYTLICDYTVLNNGQVYKNKKIRIAKAYIGIDDLKVNLEKLK